MQQKDEPIVDAQANVDADDEIQELSLEDVEEVAGAFIAKQVR